MIDAIADVLAKALRLFTQWSGSAGLAIILLTLAVKLALHPLTRKQLRSMKEMQALAPQINALREKYRDNPQQMNIEVMNLYRAHKVNPFSGCLPMLMQLPVLWALFTLLRRQGIFNGASFLGLPLEAVPTFGAMARDPILAVIPILSGVSTYWQQRMSITDPQQARMFVFMPVLIAYFATQFPVGLSIYWIASTLLSIVEYYLVLGWMRPARAAGGSAKGPEVLPQRPRRVKRK